MDEKWKILLELQELQESDGLSLNMSQQDSLQQTSRTITHFG
jgi:hypothetical protein